MRDEEYAPRSHAKVINDSAYKLFDEGRPLNEVIELQLRAVDEVRRNGAPETVKILQQAGYFYTRKVDLYNGLKYMREASDSLKHHDITDVNRKDVVFLYGNLSNIYTRLRLYKEALEVNSMAIANAKGSNEILLSDLWRFRAAVYDQMDAPYDSVFFCLGKAKETALLPKGSESKKRIATADFQKYGYFIEHDRMFPDSLEMALRCLESVPDSVVPPIFSVASILWKGRAYVITGNPAKGIAMLELGLRRYREKGDMESVQFTQKMLMRSYAESGMGEKMATMYPDYEANSDSIAAQVVSDAILGADFRYRVAEKDKELAKLRKEMDEAYRSEQRHRIALASIVFASIIAVWRLYVFIMRLKRQRNQMKEKIDGLIDHQKHHTVAVEKLQNLVDNLQLEIKRRDDESLRRDNEELVDKMLKSLDPALFSGETEQKFRKSFMSLYPRFLRELRADCPQLTPSDEMICMLIYMHQTNEEISQCLGITRMSVNTARFRLRKKLALGKDTDLDTYIRSRPV